MTFPYLDLSRGGVIRAKPIIPIRFHGPQGFRQIVALVDSGAEHSVVSIELIESLGLPTKNAQAVEVIGVGGHAGRGYLLDVEHQLALQRTFSPHPGRHLGRSVGITPLCLNFAMVALVWLRRALRLRLCQ